MTDQLVQRAKGRIGSTIGGKWTIDGLLGVGGMASVYSATHRNRKRVAVKILHRELAVVEGLRERFLREGYVANTVEHPGVVAVDDDGVTDDGAAFLIMELLLGETLDERWKRNGRRLPPEEVIQWTRPLLEALVVAHGKGIVHRDLKPENLFVTSDSRLKVLDFGIARLRELSTGTSTQSGAMMGTPSFMAPEQAKGRWDEVDARTDLWAVGATMFTLLSGQYVHDAETVNETLVKAVTAPAPPIADVCEGIPPELAEIVDRALAYEKADRFSDASAMLAAFTERRLVGTIVVSSGKSNGQVSELGATAATPTPNMDLSPQRTEGAVTAAERAPIPKSSLAPMLLLISLVGGGAIALIVFGSFGGGTGSNTLGTTDEVTGQPSSGSAGVDVAPAPGSDTTVEVSPSVAPPTASASSDAMAPASASAAVTAAPTVRPSHVPAAPPPAPPAATTDKGGDPFNRRF